MNKIQKLPDHIANQIAAGEVIQRPASVIKELMENSIDAGATSVHVNIKDAGKTLIQIIDDGVGMGSSDAILCFERHATSKITKADDLFNLATKGFRGEALASIAAISHVELRTKRSEDSTGHLVRIEGSRITEQNETVCPNGTQFEIKNLFYNVPARRNFLKSDKVEFGHITDEFIRVALAHPSVAFKLTHNGSILYDLRDAVLRKRIIDILGKNTNDRLVPIEESTDIVQLKGFVLKPEFSKKSRGEQFLFVNDRFFKSTYFNHAITRAYDGLLKEGYFPSYFIYMDVNPQRIDVNVHPTKTEIKFEEEKLIYSILVSSIRQALGKFNIAPSLDFDRETSFDLPLSMKDQPAYEPEIKVNTEYNPFQETSSSSTSSGSSSKNYTSAIKSAGFGKEMNFDQKDWENFYSIKEEETVVQNCQISDLFTDDISYIVKGNYLVIPAENGFLMIHARRAYEQVIFSDSMKRFILRPLNAQTLLFPTEIEVSRSQSSLIEENINLLRQLGFELELTEETLSLTAVPEFLEEETIRPCMEEILGTLEFEDPTEKDLAQGVLATVAKSAAMKKLDLQNKEHTKRLIQQLFECDQYIHTVDGRRIIVEMNMEEIGNKFN